MSNDPKPIKKVMISSTARDLPEHRKEVLDACLRQGMFPVMMEHLPANDDEAISASLKMVDGADIYVGIFAHRYGYVLTGHAISVTEMEYNRAVERKIPRCIFIMHEDHPIKASDMDIENAAKLKTFKDRVLKENIVNLFKSPAELRGNVIDSLSNYREADITSFHYVSDIPQPPEAYIAHPYTLLQTHRLVGRQNELNLLTNWVTKKQEGIYWARVLSIVAIGGMGKSAVTWKWFNDIAPQEMKPLAGRMWWSYYESDASFENFVIRALAYVSKNSIEKVKQISPPERETQLLAVLDREPFMLVLDGLERILLAYARMDAARLTDDDIDQRTANYVARTYGLPESAAQSFVGQHLLRKTTDPRAGSFLRKLANVRSSRILVSTRLYPADLQSVTGEPINGCSAIFLRGLNDDDALNLWRAFNVSGAREILLPLFHKFENHPLLMQSLASEIANHRRAPGDFERWQKDHPKFDPFSLPMTQVKGHVLGFAMQGLYKNARKVLETIAGFRMPAHYDTLASIFVGEEKLFPTELGLDQALKELEDRGLLGWDKRANRYDLHPIVRGVVWSGLPDDTRNGVFSSLQAHFDSVPKIDDYRKVKSLEDLSPTIELYNTLIGLRRYDDAAKVFDYRLDDALHNLSATRQRIELLEMLFPEGLERWPFLQELTVQIRTVDNLAIALVASGQPGNAVPIFRHQIGLCKEVHDNGWLSRAFHNLSNALRFAGLLHASEATARQALFLAREVKEGNLELEAFSLIRLGLALAVRGMPVNGKTAIQRAMRLFVFFSEPNDKLRNLGIAHAWLAQAILWSSDFVTTCPLADRSWELAQDRGLPRDLSRSSRLQGIAALGMNELQRADERLHHALVSSREVGWVEDELPALVGLSELRHRQGDPEVARELLDDVWELAERGSYLLFHADAFNVLAQIERDAGNNVAAVEAATKAYRLAWCDGEPYAYHWGLVAARKHLKELGAPEPEMPPFDPSKYEPMPEVEINPKDEFWVNPDKEFDIDDLTTE